MAKRKATCTAVFSRDEDGTWLVHIKEHRQCHTYGRSLAQARNRIREALALYDDDADDAIIHEEYRLPRHVKAVVKQQQRAREQAERAQHEASEHTREAARTLVEDVGLSVRDAAAILGLSYQRVQQLVSESA